MNSSSLFIFFIFLSFSFIDKYIYCSLYIIRPVAANPTSGRMYFLTPLRPVVRTYQVRKYFPLRPVVRACQVRMYSTSWPFYCTSCGPYMPGNVLPDLSKSCGPYMFWKKFLWKISCLKPVISVRSRIIKIPIHWNSIARGQIIRFL